MATLAVEQKQQQYGYQRDEATQGGPNQVNLGGFAISFEDLLQRVGARLESAFSAADKTNGIAQAKVTSPDERKDPRDNTSSRDTQKSDRSDNRKNDAPVDRARTSSSDKRDSAADRSDDKPRADAVSDNRADQTDNNARDDVKSTDKTAKADNAKHDDKAGKDKSSAVGNDGDAKAVDKADDNGQAKAAEQIDTSHASVAEAPHVIQAAAIYAASQISKSGNEAAKSNTGEAVKQAQKGVDVTENTPAQIAAVLSQKGQQTAQNHQGGKSSNTNAAAKGGEQKAANTEQKGVTPVMQAQAQQLSKAIGADNRININVNVSKDQNQLISKPTLSDSTTLVLAQDSGKSSQPAQGSQPAAQQGPNMQQMQQAQLAVQQQSQATQQSNVQNGPQGGATVANSAAGTQQIGTIQSGAGNAQHAGGNETLNNTTQSAGAAQQTQQTQQTRDAAPQQQAQHLQRSALPGSVTEQISIKISKALEAGTDKISIQLRPAELGRVDVKLEMTHDGRVMTVVSADKQDTLDLLKRDSSELQRALADAGLQSGDMQFNLKGQDKQSAEADGNDQKGAAGKVADAETEDNTEGTVMTAWESGIYANGRLDMRA